MTIDDEIMLKYDENSLEYKQAQEREEIKLYIMGLLKKAQAVWSAMYPNNRLSICLDKGYISVFSLDENKRYLMNETEVNNEVVR